MKRLLLIHIINISIHIDGEMGDRRIFLRLLSRSFPMQVLEIKLSLANALRIERRFTHATENPNTHIYSDAISQLNLARCLYWTFDKISL